MPQRPRAGSAPTSEGELSEFLLRACHDLRAPARAVRAHAELFLRGETPAATDFKERLGYIIEGARTIDGLLELLSSYALALRISPASFQPTSTGVVLRTALAKLNKEFESQHAEVTHGQLPRVTGDPDRLLDLFQQLLRNSIQHRGTGPPRIEISAESQDENWLFAVRDNGPGVEADWLERIFQPFERARGGGAGLGLAICRLIVEHHGGRIWAESRPPDGTTFWFTLPGAVS
jgi:signal transduction histidine kinase